MSHDDSSTDTEKHNRNDNGGYNDSDENHNDTKHGCNDSSMIR